MLEGLPRLAAESGATGFTNGDQLPIKEPHDYSGPGPAILSAV